MTFFDYTADLVGQKGMLQIDAPPVENFWLRHCIQVLTCNRKGAAPMRLLATSLL